MKVDFRVSFFKSLKIKFSLVSLVSTVLPIILIGFASFYLTRHAMERIGLSQIEDTLEGGYSLIEQYYGRVQRGEMSHEDAIKYIRIMLSGPVKEIWAKIASKQEAEEILRLFGTDEAALGYDASSIKLGDETIAQYNESKKLYVFSNSSVFDRIVDNYNKMNLESQRRIINEKYEIRIIRDFKKAAIKIRGSGYVWAITSNPGNKNEGKIFEETHPSLEGFNVWSSKVGKNISEMNGQIDKVKPGEIVRYDYIWQNPTDPEPRHKIVLLKYFKPWNWSIASGLYEDEFFEYLGNLKIYIILGAVLFGLLSFFLVFFLNNMIVVVPIKKMDDRIQDLNKGEGDLTQKLEVKTQDEIGKIAFSFNLFFDKLRGIIENLKKQSGELGHSSSDLASNSRETAASVHEISASIKTVVENLLNENKTIENSTGHLKEILKGISQIQAMSEDTNQKVSQASSAIQEMAANISSSAEMSLKGDEAAEKLFEASKEGNKAMSTLSSSIQEVSKNSEQIVEMVQLIMDIAEQTNLLAMNAAIEAAHAGQYGKGFAVVSEEIRKLADKSSKSAKEIQEVVKQIADNINQNMSLAEKTNESFLTLKNFVEKVKQINHEIASSMEEQKIANKSILDSITDINKLGLGISQKSKEETTRAREIETTLINIVRISQEITSAMQEEQTALQDTSTASEYVSQISAKLQEIAGQLETEFKKFKTE